MLHFSSPSEVNYQLYSLILLKELMMVGHKERHLDMQSANLPVFTSASLKIQDKHSSWDPRQEIGNKGCVLGIKKHTKHSKTNRKITHCKSMVGKHSKL